MPKSKYQKPKIKLVAPRDNGNKLESPTQQPPRKKVMRTTALALPLVAALLAAGWKVYRDRKLQYTFVHWPTVLAMAGHSGPRISFGTARIAIQIVQEQADKVNLHENCELGHAVQKCGYVYR
jgi:hypothetical protein